MSLICIPEKVGTKRALCQSKSTSKQRQKRRSSKEHDVPNKRDVCVPGLGWLGISTSVYVYLCHEYKWKWRQMSSYNPTIQAGIRIRLHLPYYDFNCTEAVIFWLASRCKGDEVFLAEIMVKWGRTVSLSVCIDRLRSVRPICWVVLAVNRLITNSIYGGKTKHGFALITESVNAPSFPWSDQKGERPLHGNAWSTETLHSGQREVGDFGQK